jgi:hypothetical protein
VPFDFSESKLVRMALVFAGQWCFVIAFYGWVGCFDMVGFQGHLQVEEPQLSVQKKKPVPG